MLASVAYIGSLRPELFVVYLDENACRDTQETPQGGGAQLEHRRNGCEDDSG